MSSLIIHNANLVSFHNRFVKGNADTIAVNGERIEAIGDFNSLKSLIHPNTTVIDAAGKTLMPGLNDTHIHIWKVGNLKTFMLDVRAAKSLDEMLSMIEVFNIRHPEVNWITARGFNEAAWKDGRMPDKDDLDKIIKDKPVYLIRTCAHIAVVNTKALELCDISSRTIAPQGGMIYKNSRGELNGIFAETALGLVTNHIPAYTKKELKQMVTAARDEMYSYGITAATDPAVDPLLLDAYYEMHEDDELGFRLNAIPILLPDGGGQAYPLPEFFSSDGFNVNTVKFFSDGGLSGKTSALKRFYKNSSERGILRLAKGQYLKLCKATMANGLGVATHAIGDAAIEFVVESYKELNREFPNAIKRIEHLGLPEEKHLRDMAEHHIATSMQTIFISELGKNFIKYLDEDYLDRCYPVRSVLKHGILTALSSDSPVVKDFNPFKGAEVAVTRKDNEGNIIAAHEGISIAEALKAYTMSAAAIGNTSHIGSLQKGKLADFILLDKDPLTIKPEMLTSVNVEKTFVGGKCVWEKTNTHHSGAR
ncbi:MAG: amidohydrolase family protein [Bacteroidetes bacterium]|nr:amidohydrolase family protein [Bacteroidota bacterium]